MTESNPLNLQNLSTNDYKNLIQENKNLTDENIKILQIRPSDEEIDEMGIDELNILSKKLNILYKNLLIINKNLRTINTYKKTLLVS
jgi:hypothetical protein